MGSLLGMGLVQPSLPSLGSQAASARRAPSISSLVWVWKFSADGPLQEIRETLARNRLGVILKTHDGTEWMKAFDRSDDAITGPEQISRLAAGFEEAGIPFHAWCVVKGTEPLVEARMCADALEAGARSLFLDLEPPEEGNYWQGTAADAVAFGEELRRLAPNAWITVAPDARPWQAGAVPLPEFMAFSNAVAPQSYWETFQGPTNRRRYQEHGYHVGPEGVTPELVIEAGIGTFQHFGRPIYPIGQGASSPDMWRRFVSFAAEKGIDSVSLWRYGASDYGAFEVLRDVAPPLGAADLPVLPIEETPEAEPAESLAVNETNTTTVEPPVDVAAKERVIATDSSVAVPSPLDEQRLAREQTMPLTRSATDVSRVFSRLVRDILGLLYQ